MIKFTYTTSKKRVNMGLGLSRENVNRLIDGQPIRISLEEMAVAVDGEIMIFFGETEREMTDNLAQFIGPETNVTISPRLKSKLT
jgi:hypothetical protein